MGLQIFSGEGYVTNVAVLPEYRRRGIAQRLIFAEFENGMDFITLEVRKSNTPAIRLYEKAGFENVGIRPHFYTSPDEDAVIMTKNLKRIKIYDGFIFYVVDNCIGLRYKICRLR